MKTVLFVCSGNTCRSPMAESLFDDSVEDYPRLRELNVTAESAGTFACDGANLHELAEEALEEIGTKPTKHHKAQPIDEKIVDEADLILCMQEQHMEELCALYPQAEEKVHTFKGFACGVDGFTGMTLYDIEDPYREPLEGYVECANEIKKYVAKIMARLEKEWSL